MALFPILLEWEGAPCLIAGGGSLALHKAKLLCAQGADVTVVAPKILPEFASLPVTLRLRKVTPEDAAGRFLVVDATGDEEAQRLLKDACEASHIPFNSACKGEDTTAMFPAVYRQGRTTVAVSSLGASPAASTWLRDRLVKEVPSRMEEILDCLAALRPLSRERSGDQPTRRRFLRRCLDIMLQEDRPLAAEEIDPLWQEIIHQTL